LTIRAMCRCCCAFTRTDDTQAQGFARRLGAVWADDSTKQPPEKLNAAILFAPVGSLVVDALKVRPCWICPITLDL